MEVMRIIMEFKQIRSFISVVENGSFSKAAQELYLSQPAISSHIKQLETEFGSTFIDRSKKDIVLTKSGEEFIQYARSIYNTCKEIHSHFQFQNTKLIRIGASSVPSETFLAEVILKFHRKFGKVHLEIEKDNSEDIIEKVRNGSLTIGIVGTSVSADDLVFECLARDKIILVAPNSPYYQKMKMSKTPIEDIITKEPIILKMDHSGTYQASKDFLNGIGISMNDLNLVARASDTQMIKKLLMSGMGISILSVLSVMDELHLKSMISLFDEDHFVNRHFFMVYRKDLVVSDPISLLMSEIHISSKQNDL